MNAPLVTTETTMALEPLVLPPAPPLAKPGFVTSEFAMTLTLMLGALGGQLAEFFPPPWGLIAASVVTCLYTIARTLLKVRALPVLVSLK
jgi:hypothetical protein